MIGGENETALTVMAKTPAIYNKTSQVSAIQISFDPTAFWGHKVSKRFGVTPVELIGLIPEADQKELTKVVQEIEKKEAELGPYGEAVGKGKQLSDGEWDIIHEVMYQIELSKVQASFLLQPIYEARKREQAEIEKDQFLSQGRDTIKRFKKELSKKKRPKSRYPGWLTAYHPNLWCELTLPTKRDIQQWAEPYVWQKVPQPLKNFISWEPSWRVKILPHAEYKLLGVPCLVWHFRILVLVEARLRMVEAEFTKGFHGYKYHFAYHAETLGSFSLEPVEWDCREELTTPTALLVLLEKGVLEGSGVDVAERGSSSTIFAVEGFEEETIELGDDFLKFIKDMAKEQLLPEALLARGVIDEITTKLLEGKWKVAGTAAQQSTNEDVISALEAMGYKKGEIKKALETTPLSPGVSIEEKVKAVLKNMGI